MSVARILSYRTRLINFKTNFQQNFKLPEKYKGTFIERWTNYWKSLINDYTEVAVDTVNSIRTSPIKTSLYVSIGGFVYLCAKNNPDEASFITEIRRRNYELILVHPSCQRAESANYLISMERAINEGILRTLNLGLFRLAWLDNHSRDLCTYEASCSHLKPEYITFYKRIVDMGFWNRWWQLDKKMIDYDIPEEL